MKIQPTLPMAFFFLFLAVVGPSAWGQSDNLPDDYELELDENGKVPPDFWTYEIPFNPVTQSLTFIDTHMDMTKQSEIDIDSEKETVDGGGDPTQYNQDIKKIDGLIQILAQGGVGLEVDDRTGKTPEENVAEFNVDIIGTSNLNLWKIGDLCFFVNPLKPNLVIPFNLNETDDDSDILLDSSIVQTLAPNVYRVLCNIEGRGNGCGGGTLRWLSILDIDFNHSTWVRTDFKNISYAADLNKDGKYELVLDPSIVEDIYFPWIYGWDGTKWVDQRAEFWPLYESGKLGPYRYCGADLAILEGLNQAIQNKEPLRYWENSEVAETPGGTVSEYLGSAKKFLAAKDYSSAITNYQKALALDGTNSKVYVYLGYAYILNGQMAQAQDALNRAIAWDFSSPLAHYNLALCDWVFRDQGESDLSAKAASEMVKAFDLDPSLKTIARQTPKLKDLLKTPEFQSALFWRNYHVPDDFLKAFPNVPIKDWAGQTFIFLRNPYNTVQVWEDDAAQKPVTNAASLQGRTFKILGPIEAFDPQHQDKPQVLHIQMSDDGHHYLLHTYVGGDCPQIASCGDYQKVKDRWLGHDLWMVSQKPVTLTKGTILTPMQKVTVEDVQWGDWFAFPIRLILQTSAGVTDSIDVGVDFGNSEDFNLSQSGLDGNYWSQYFDRIKSGKDGGNYFCNLFTDQDPVSLVKEYLSQTVSPKRLKDDLQ